MFKARMMGLLAGACLFGMASPAFAQPATVTEKVAEFESASQQLTELYVKAKAVAEQIDAATKKQEAAELALRAALQGIDPTSQQDGKVMEEGYAKMEAARESIAAAEREAHDSAAVADEAADEPEQE
jgi:hypothetical protein